MQRPDIINTGLNSSGGKRTKAVYLPTVNGNFESYKQPRWKWRGVVDWAAFLLAAAALNLSDEEVGLCITARRG